MDAQQPKNWDKKRRPQGIRLQRFPFGSRDTNTVNTPPTPPCHLHHLLISEQWPTDKTSDPDDKKVHRDPAVIIRDIRTKQKALDDACIRLDRKVLDDVEYKTNTDRYESDTRAIKHEILEIQKEILALDLERIAAQSRLGPYQPPVGLREFIVVDEIPADIEQQIKDAETQLEPLREQMNKAYDDWFEAHTKHEAVKKEYLGFAKKKQKLADARDKARTEYELARRQEIEREASPALREKSSKVKKFLKVDAKSKLEKAQKGKTASRAELEAAISAYSTFASYGFGEIRTREEALYKTLIAKLKEVHDLSNRIGEIETRAQAAKNTLKTPAKIQMTSFEKGYDQRKINYWAKKVPWVTVEVNGKTALFPAEDTFCTDDPPKHNNTYLHPDIHVVEPESKIDHHGSLPANSPKANDKPDAKKIPPRSRSVKFRIFELHRKIFAPVKTGVFAVLGSALTDAVAILQHIFSFFPKKRHYKIVAQTCGVDSRENKMPAKLEAELEVYPADTYTITLKMQPAMGYEITQSERVSDTTGIKGEAAYSDAENAASKADHTISKAESFSVFGVVQNSTTTSVTKSDAYMKDGELVPAREITTVSTLTRDGGIFGSATVTDVSTGTLDGGATQYQSTVVMKSSLGDPLTDGTDLKSMKQSYTDADGNVTDASKTVDSQGMATTIEGDASGDDAGVKGGRPPSVPSSYMPQIPIDLVLARNGVEDPVTQDLRQTLGLIIFLVRKCADIAGRIGNMMPSIGWTYGFSMQFLTGSLAYSHGHKEHVDNRVWLKHRFDLDMNLITAKVFVFGGAYYEFLLFSFQFGIEANVKGSIGVKGHFEKTHPDAKKNWEIGFGPTGGIGIGVELKAIAGQPDWISATGSVESGVTAEAIYWMVKNGESAPFLDVSFKWEGVKLKGVLHVILVGHWEVMYPICDERMIWAGRFPKIQKQDEIKQMLDNQTAELEASGKQRRIEAAAREKKFRKQNKLPKIKK